LREAGVDYVVVDDLGPLAEPWGQHHQLLRQALEESAGDFALVGRFTIEQRNRRYPDAVLLYEYQAPPARVALGSRPPARTGRVVGARDD
jgi:hypothetical protein